MFRNSIYDKYWLKHINEIQKGLLEAIDTGKIVEIDIDDIKYCSDERHSWNGKIILDNYKLLHGEMAHARALGKIILRQSFYSDFAKNKIELSISNKRILRINASKLSSKLKKPTIEKKPTIIVQNSLEKFRDEELWRLALANPVPLFLTLEDNPSVVQFDDKGFFFSKEAEKIYQNIKSEPHIYVARFKSNDWIYIGKSNQLGGRWKRSHYYHLGGLAHEILGTTKHNEQNHSNWIESWFDTKTLKITRKFSKFCIQMKQEVVISFYVLETPVTKDELGKAESRLVSLAREKGLNVLNVLK